MELFNAMIVQENEDGKFTRDIKTKALANLPDGEVLVKVAYSSLNYKDALSATGNRGVTKNYPHTPGIDASGLVVESTVDQFKEGDEVIVTSYDLGMNTDGGFGEFIRVPSDWVVPLPEGLTLKESMIYGTAGFTAAMSVNALIEGGIKPDMGEVLVSGATGGVGSISVAILKKLGFTIAGVSGKTHEAEYLKSLGVTTILSIEDAIETSGRPLFKPRWAGCIDTVGGDILSTAIKSTKPNGVVTSCGNAAGPNLDLTVFPFILRGIKLVGIDSQNCPMQTRKKVWHRLATDWKLENTDRVVNEVSLKGVGEKIEDMLAGRHKGRTIIFHK